MKKLLLSLFTILVFNANASVMTVETTQVADSLLVDFYLTDANPDIYDFTAIFEFDYDSLEEDLFFGDSGFEQNIELNSVAIIDGFYESSDDSFYISALFGLDWSDSLSLDLSNLFLGSAAFNIIDINFDEQFTLTSTQVYDAFDDEISAQSVQEVPEPPAIAIFALGLLALSRFKVKR